MASPLEADRPTPTGAELPRPAGARAGAADWDETDLGEPDEAPPERYDRSSLPGDYLVAIEDQTPEDWERLAPESGFCEYLDGVVYMPSPVSDRHQEIVKLLLHLLDGYQCERGTGEVLMGPAVLRVSWGRKPEPDLFVRPTADQAAPGGAYADVPAVLVVEVLSPSNRDHDLVRKAKVYRRAGIPEIWYVDEPERVVSVDRRGPRRYRRERHAGGILRAAALPGFWIDIGWLWADPLPNRRRCLEAILAGPPADA